MKKFVMVVAMLLVSTVATAADLGSVALGALVGGAVGHQFGGGRGQDVATLAGVIVGGKIATKIVDGDRKQYVCVENCAQQSQYAQQQYNPGVAAAYARGQAERAARYQRDQERAAYHAGGGTSSYYGGDHVVWVQ